MASKPIIFLVLFCSVYLFVSMESTPAKKRMASFDHEFLGGNFRFRKRLESSEDLLQEFDRAYYQLRNRLRQNI